MAAPLAVPPAFRHRDFRLAQVARFLGVLAIQMQSVAVGWQVYEITRQPLDLGFVGLVQFLPAVGLSLVAGHVADRFDRRRIVALCYGAYALSAIALLTLGWVGVSSPWPIYGVLFGFGVARAFGAPASGAILPSLVPAEELAGAIAWSSSIFQMATITGPALGGAIYGLAGRAGAVYACSGVFYVCAGTCILALRGGRGAADKAPPNLAQVFAGVRYIWQQKVVLGAISLDLFAVLLGGATALLPAYARDILHVGPGGLGLLRAAPSVGALVVAVTLAVRPLARHAGVAMLGCVALFGVATIVFGFSKSVPLSVCALAVAGAADMISVVVRLTLVQLRTPEAMRGRVGAVNLVFIGASNELGEFESGLMAAWIGVVPAVVVGGVGTLAVVALWTLLFPALRKVDGLRQA